MELIILLAILIGFGLLGRFVFLLIFDSIFKNQNKIETKSTYIDKSIHHHYNYNDNRTAYLDGNKITPNSNKS